MGSQQDCIKALESQSRVTILVSFCLFSETKHINWNGLLKLQLILCGRVFRF